MKTANPKDVLVEMEIASFVKAVLENAAQIFGQDLISFMLSSAKER